MVAKTWLKKYAAKDPYCYKEAGRPIKRKISRYFATGPCRYRDDCTRAHVEYPGELTYKLLEEYAEERRQKFQRVEHERNSGKGSSRSSGGKGKSNSNRY